MADDESTLYVIAYDIPSDRRRGKVHNVLSGCGRWTQYSLFEAWLTPKELVALQGKLDGHIKPGEDSVRFYRLCSGCVKVVETIGSPPPREERVFVV